MQGAKAWRSKLSKMRARRVEPGAIGTETARAVILHHLVTSDALAGFPAG